MGLQNFESLVTKDTSKQDCSQKRISSLHHTNSTGQKVYRQTLLTGQVLVVQSSPNACKLAVGKVSSGVPDMPNKKEKSKTKEEKRFIPYPRPLTASKTSDQNYLFKNESGKSGSRMTLALERLPLRDLSTETGDCERPLPASVNSIPSPFLSIGSISGRCTSKPEASPSRLQSGCIASNVSSSEGRQIVATKAQNFFPTLMSPSKESPVAPPFSPLSEESNQLESPIGNISRLATQNTSRVFSEGSKKKNSMSSPPLLTAKEKAGKALGLATKLKLPASQSPRQHSSLQRKKSSRDAQYMLKVKEDPPDVIIVSCSSEDSCASGSSKHLAASSSSSLSSLSSSSSSSSSLRKGKKMRIHRRLKSRDNIKDKDVIVIDDNPLPRKRGHQSSSSSDEFEKPLCKKQRPDRDIIDLTGIEDSPPRVRGAKTTPSRRNDPNRTPELHSSSDEGSGNDSRGTSRLKGQMPVRKTLQFPCDDMSDLEMTPAIDSESKFSYDKVDDVSSDEEKASGIDGFISIVDKLTEKNDDERLCSEKLYENLSESSSFHSFPSVDETAEKSPATPKLKVNGNLELVQGFTLDLNSEEDDDDVFDDQKPTPSASSGTLSSFEHMDTPINPVQSQSSERIVSQTHEMNVILDDVTVAADQQQGNRFDVEKGKNFASSQEDSENVEGDARKSSATNVLKDCDAVQGAASAQSLNGIGADASETRSLLDVAGVDDVDEPFQPVVGKSSKEETIIQDGKNKSVDRNKPNILCEDSSNNSELKNSSSTDAASAIKESPVQSPKLEVLSTLSQTRRPHVEMTNLPSLLESSHSAGARNSCISIPLSDMRPVLKARGVDTRLVVEDKVDFFTMTQDNVVGNQLQDDTRLPSQRLCFVAKYLRLFTSRTRIPSAENLARLWQLLWKPLVSGGDQLTEEAVGVCMQYLRQLLVFHPPGQHGLVDQQYDLFLSRVAMDDAKASTFPLWGHLELLLRCQATVRMASFMIDLLLADLWAASTTGRSSPPLFVRLFWNGPARNLSLPIRSLMNRIDSVGAELDKSLSHHDQLDNLMTLLYMAGTACSDMSTELIVRWRKLKGHTQSFLVARVSSTSLQSRLTNSLPEVKKIHALYNCMFSTDLEAFSTKVKSVQLHCPDLTEPKTKVPEKRAKADQPPVFVCTKSKHSVLSSQTTPLLQQSSVKRKHVLTDRNTSIDPIPSAQQLNVRANTSRNQQPTVDSSSSNNSSSTFCTDGSTQNLGRQNSANYPLQVVTSACVMTLENARRVELYNQPSKALEGVKPSKSHKEHCFMQESNNNNNTAHSLITLKECEKNLKGHSEASCSTPNLKSPPKHVEKMISKSTEGSFNSVVEKSRSNSADGHECFTNKTSKQCATDRHNHQKVRKKSKEELSKTPPERISKASCHQAPSRPDQQRLGDQVEKTELPRGRPIDVIIQRRSNSSPAQKLWQQQLGASQQKPRVRRFSGDPHSCNAGKVFSKVIQPRRSSLNLTAKSRESTTGEGLLHMNEDSIKTANAAPCPTTNKVPDAMFQGSHSKSKSDNWPSIGHQEGSHENSDNWGSLKLNYSVPLVAQSNTGSSQKPPVPKVLPLKSPTVSRGSTSAKPCKPKKQQVCPRKSSVDVPTQLTSPKTHEQPHQKPAQMRSPKSSQMKSPKSFFPLFVPSKQHSQQRKSTDTATRSSSSLRQLFDQPMNDRQPQDSSSVLKQRLVEKAFRELNTTTPDFATAPTYQQVLQQAGRSTSLSDRSSTESRKAATPAGSLQDTSHEHTDPHQHSLSNPTPTHKNSPGKSAFSSVHSPNQHQSTPPMDNTKRSGKKADSRQAFQHKKLAYKHASSTPHISPASTDRHIGKSKSFSDLNKNARPGRQFPPNDAPNEHK